MAAQTEVVTPVRALREMLKLVEDGVLVRNTKDDDNFAQYATDAFRLVQVLKQAQEALATQNQA